MKNFIERNTIWTIPLMYLIILLISITIGYILYTDNNNNNNNIDNNNTKTYIIKNNSTRDYKYEHYCDSIYIMNLNYYLDVIVESDEFQNYIDKHGQWWTN